MTKSTISKSGAPKAAKPKPMASPKPKSKTRQVQLKSLLSRKSGATVHIIKTAFAWKPHSVRAAVSGLRKAGENIERIQTSSGTAYRIVSVEAAK